MSALICSIFPYVFIMACSGATRSTQIFWGKVDKDFNMGYCTSSTYSAAIQCDVLYRTVLLYCTVQHCSVLYCTVLYCTTVLLYCTVLYCTVLYCTVLYCTVLYCTVLYCTVECSAVQPYHQLNLLVTENVNLILNCSTLQYFTS